MQSVLKVDDPEQKFLDGTLVGVPSPTPGELQTPMDADKASIYRFVFSGLFCETFLCTSPLSVVPQSACRCCVHRHPLFPLLALLFEKCEQSTLSSDCITSASFDVDIENFVRCQEKEGKPFFSEDPELDNLVSCLYFVTFGRLLEENATANREKSPNRLETFAERLRCSENLEDIST